MLFKDTSLLLFSGNANPVLAKEISKHLNISLSTIDVSKFSDGETRVKIGENVRGQDVFVIQPTCPPVNENLMELLIIIDALKRASARRITAVIPYFGYARQDRKDQPRVPITAKLVANLLTIAGAERLLTVDLHAEQIQGFFDIPVDNLYGVNAFLEYFKKNKIEDLVVVSPDVGGIKIARAYAKRFNVPLAVVDKRRIDDKKIEVMHIIGDVKDKNVLLVDDIIATAGSISEASEALKKAGAKDIYAAITHPILANPAIERIEKCPLKKLIVSDTIPISSDKSSDKIEVISIANLFGEAITRIHEAKSISILFH